MAGAVQPEGGDGDVVCVPRRRFVEPAGQPQQILAPGHLTGGRPQHPLGVGEQRLQRAQGGVA